MYGLHTAVQMQMEMIRPLWLRHARSQVHKLWWYLPQHGIL
jgi:hypothetical protein